MGRDAELDALARLLEHGRLITVCGAAGCGKTVLASEAARRWSARGARALALADLANVRPTDSLVLSIARATGIHASQRSSIARLQQVLGQQPVVLVLDHIEQLRAQYAELAQLVDRCPHLIILTACLSPLGLPGEHVLQLHPLPVPRPGAPHDELTRSPSVQLFSRRARAIDTTFTLDESNLEAVGAVCRLLNGLPLALNLAAARVRILPVSELVHHLEGSVPGLDVLSHPRCAPGDRHRSIRATLEWSFSLLDPSGQRLFAALALFAGSFTVDAAARVAAQDLNEVLDGLSALVDAWLVEPLSTAAGPTEFALLPIVREFARESLETLGLTAAARQRYAAHLLTIARAAAAQAEDRNSGTGLADVRAHCADFLALLEWLQQVDFASAVRLVSDLAPAVLAHPEQQPVITWLDRLLESPDLASIDIATRARAWLWSAMLLAHSPVPTELAGTIADRWQRGIVLAREQPDGLLTLTGLWIGLLISPTCGRLREATEIGSEARDLALRLAHPRWLSCFESLSGMAAHQLGDLEQAAALGISGLRRARRLDYGQGIVQACLLLKTMPPQAVPVVGQLPTFLELYTMCLRIDDPMSASYVLAALAYESIAEHRALDAAAWSVRRLDLLISLGWMHLTARSLMHLGMVAAQLGAPDRAASLHGAIRPYLPLLTAHTPPAHAAAYTQQMSQVRDQLGAARFDQIIASSTLVSLTDAITAVLPWARNVVGCNPVHLRSRTAGATKDNTPHLSARELEVLVLIAQGLSNKQIAARLTVSAKTVMHHSTAIYRKLGVRGRAEATAHAYRHHLVNG